MSNRPPADPPDRRPPAARGYDAVAADYDRLVVRDVWMRRVLWRHYARRFRAGHHVVEVGCGTGLDTLFLARRGVRVTALDISPGMIGVLRAKAEAESLAEWVDARVEDAADLGSVPAASAAGIVTAFAALNAVGDLGAFSAAAYRVLRPGGRLVAHLLGHGGVWERIAAEVRPVRSAGAGATGDGTRVITICGEPVRHTLLPAAAVFRRFFAGQFRRRRSYGLGFLCPAGAVARLPVAVAAALGRAEAGVGAVLPFLDWGRFFVLDLQRKP